MKTSLKIMAVLALLLGAASFTGAQTITLMDWNIKSFECTDLSGQNAGFPIADHVAKIKAVNPDVLTLNEFESATDRMSNKEKAAELGAALGMYCYFIASYEKSGGYYGNAILSKYPIVNASSMLFEYKHHLGEGNYIVNSGEEEPSGGGQPLL